jgi:hypothetical protein
VCCVGQEANGVYLLLSGQMTVSLQEEKVSTLSSGQFFGLMGYISKEQIRNSHISSATDTEVCVIKYEDLTIIENNFPEIFIQLQRAALLSWTGIIKNQINIMLLKKKKIRSLSSFCCTALFMLTFNMLLVCLALKHFNGTEYEMWISSGGIMFMVLIFGLMVYGSSFSARLFGLTLENWRYDIMESVCWTIGFLCLGVLIVKWIFLLLHPSHGTLFDFPIKRFSTTTVIIYPLVYAILSFVQEFCYRGVCQGVLMSVSDNLFQRIRNIFLVGTGFTVAHLHLPSGWFTVAVMIPSLFWSVLYEKQQRRLLGVCVSHCLFGVFVLFVVGFGDFIQW